MNPTAKSIYRDVLGDLPSVVADWGAGDEPGSELAAQARWFAGDFGTAGTTVEGAAFVVEDFGRWNHEAGPDFIDVRIRFARDERRGAVELDLDARDWERHGHAGNPAFRATILHVFFRAPAARFFTRDCDHREIPQWHLSPPAEIRRPAEPETISADPARVRAMLEAAARHRMDLKAAALRRHAALRGEDEAWFSALAVALGYKRNQTPFLLLAQRLGLADAGSEQGEALLFGLAGFLEAPEPPAVAREVRTYLRGLWERWWAERARLERLILPASAWNFAGVRPGNHPHRRVAALARIAAGWPSVRRSLAAGDAAGFSRALAELAHPFWNSRFNLAAGSLRGGQALVGAQRAADMRLNVLFPWWISQDEAGWEAFRREPGPAPAATMRETAARFFGGAVELSSALSQQGLLQIARDFRDSPDPARFLDALRRAEFPAVDAGSTRPARRLRRQTVPPASRDDP